MTLAAIPGSRRQIATLSIARWQLLDAVLSFGMAHPAPGRLPGNPARPAASCAASEADVVRYIDLKLAALGHASGLRDSEFLEIARPLLRNYHQKDLMLGNLLCPADRRIQSFLDNYLGEVSPNGGAQIPGNTFLLDRPGLARVMSLPLGKDTFSSPFLQSYRLPQGILHNPKTDRRTTQGIFHIVEGGLPVPADKEAVPKKTFAALLAAAFDPPADLLTLPFSALQDEGVQLFVSLLIRPIVCPATERDPIKTMEIRFFAPGSLVSNLDFVEGVFGNAGDPYLPENDAALDAMHWTGHTGCVIVAPHLAGIKKKDVGLPHEKDATDRQRRDRMCWRDPDEPYNGGGAFKIACRDQRGIMVTIIADNYYGYCKKEVKTQISFAANLYGLCEEEHAGGAIAFATYVLGQDFQAANAVSLKKARFREAMEILGPLAERGPEGYAIDTRYSNIYYVPEDSEFSVRKGLVEWKHDGGGHLALRADSTYVLPNGFRLQMEKQSGGSAWRLVGARPRGTLCHKPCTVSGGGKSEISKSIANVILEGPVFVGDFQRDIEQVADILRKDFSEIYENRAPDERARRPILSPERTMGSVIQLFTPSPEYKQGHNAWIGSLSYTIRELLFTVKRYYRPEWGDGWREHFAVDRVNGVLGHELKFDNQKLVNYYLRVGYDQDGSWRIYKLRPDFHPAYKVQVEDDITASVVLPRESLSGLDPEFTDPSVKLVTNCETLLFQRPDDAIHRGADKQAEADIASPATFLTNYEPFTVEQAAGIVSHVSEFDKFTNPMKNLLERFIAGVPGSYVVSSAHPRLVGGKPSKNPRYLQKRPDLENPRDSHLAEIAARLERQIPVHKPVHFPVNSVLAGRRNSPPDPEVGLPPLAVYNPIHYQELPELFMEFVSSLTGKSPSTTGFGSEGALTKAPFNALWPVVDLNNALVSAIVTGYAGFTTSAGYVGPNVRVDHDISMLVPEVWCRMRVHERDPRFMIAHGLLERVKDFEFRGQAILASRLGYRITTLFADRFLGRFFETPDAVFAEEMLRPEKQSLELFSAGVRAIVDAQRRVALNYFEDGSVRSACPPLHALLHIMAYGTHEGMTLENPHFRKMFEREVVLASDWYQERLRVKQERDVALWRRHVAALENFQLRGPFAAVARDFNAEERGRAARAELARVTSPAYLFELRGTIGADPFTGQAS
jgi:phosphoenolpyruvate carboxykinase (diphosphate)